MMTSKEPKEVPIAIANLLMCFCNCFYCCCFGPKVMYLGMRLTYKYMDSHLSSKSNDYMFHGNIR